MSSGIGGTQSCGIRTFYVLQIIFPPSAIERRNTLPMMTRNKGSQSLCLRGKTCRTMSKPRATVIQHFCPSASSTLSTLVDHHFIKRDILGLHMTAVWELNHSWFKASYDDYVTQPLTSLSVSLFLQRPNLWLLPWHDY